MNKTIRLAAALVATAACHSLAAGLDPAAVTYTKVEDIKWVDSAAGTSAQSVIYGDPSKPGPYAVFLKWKAGNMSRPHFHPNNRYITVLSGTWWVGSGETYDPASTVPLGAGTFVVHTGKQVHYDGAKEGDVIIVIHGEGPATSTPAEKK
jgi:oxalate decarboxylase/phosphoglucose isomerase-like protein (cupin superfamily)